MEALVAGYNHTGNRLYIKYMAQMLHHQLELNKRMSEASGGKNELCGHYNMYKSEFDKGDDGLTVVSNLFLFPYVKAFKLGFRSPHSTIILLPRDSKNLRVFHLSGIREKVKIIMPAGRKAAKLTFVKNGAPGGAVKFKTAAGAVNFEALPYQMYALTVK